LVSLTFSIVTRVTISYGPSPARSVLVSFTLSSVYENVHEVPVLASIFQSTTS
jgi:hypothetical protein